MASSPALGQPAPELALEGGVLTDDGFRRSRYVLSGQRGRAVVLAFYPGDDTAVCTRQMCSYSSGLEQFAALDAQVWGISPQGVDSHEAFARKYDLRFPLLADPDRTAARAFGVAAPGIGLRRSVFVVASDGSLHWKHVALLGATFQPVGKLTERLRALSAAD
jgi:thioredoxin-dependent peroxiredoxin